MVTRRSVRARIARWFCRAALLVAMLTPAIAVAATTARTDRSVVRSTDSFQVVFETDQEVSSRPDFGVLETDFDVLGTSQSTSVNIINGRMQRSARWIVDLMAKREGVLTIPPITIGNERSNALTITVQPGPAGGEAAGDVLLEVEVDTETPYVQQQVVLTFRLLRAVPIGNASLTEPNISGGDVIVERLGDDVSYETQRGGRRLAVIERRYALAAQNSGRITIEPFVFEARVVGGSQSAFDPFARGRIVRARSEAVEIDVRPIPAGFAGPAWLPARQLFLVESWPDDAPEYRVGEPVTRTLTLQANGLGSSQLPEIGAGVPNGIRQYPDQPVLEDRVGDTGLVGSRQEKVALIPSSAGTLTLPAVEIPWWNTRTDRLEHARLPERTIEVVAAAGAPAAPAPAPQASDIDAPAPQPPPPGSATIWPWLSAGLAAGWLLTVLAWWLTRRRAREPAAQRVRPPSERRLVAGIRAACDGDDAEAARDAMLAWADHHWPGSRVHSLGELAARVGGDLQRALHELGRHLYGGGDGAWRGASLRAAFDAHVRRRTARPARREPELEPLYLR